MAIYIIDTLQQKNGAIFPLVEDVDLKGGLRVVADTIARDAIDTVFRTVGMIVVTSGDGKMWRLDPPGDNTNWTELTFGGGGGDATVDTRNASVAVTAGQPVSLDSGGDLVVADAGAGQPQEVYGLVLTPGGPGNVQVVTEGVCTYSPGGLTPGDILYLGVGGGVTNTPPSLLTPDQAIVRIGTARTSGSILVRVQWVAVT